MLCSPPVLEMGNARVMSKNPVSKNACDYLGTNGSPSGIRGDSLKHDGRESQ
jgi:hypothetical protein